MERLAALAQVSRATIASIEAGEPCRDTTRRAIEKALEAETADDRISRLEADVAELRRDLAVLLGFAERLASPPAPQRSDGPGGRRGRR